MLDRLAQSGAALTFFCVLAGAVFGLATWTTMPSFPPPAANESLLLLRRVITVALLLSAVILAPFAAGARALRIVGAGAALFTGMTNVFASQAYRELQWASAFTAVSGLSVLTALLLIAAGLSPRTNPR